MFCRMKICCLKTETECVQFCPQYLDRRVIRMLCVCLTFRYILYPDQKGQNYTGSNERNPQLFQSILSIGSAEITIMNYFQEHSELNNNCCVYFSASFNYILHRNRTYYH